MEKDIGVIEKKNTWTLLTLLMVCEAIGIKQVFKIKKNASRDV